MEIKAIEKSRVVENRWLNSYLVEIENSAGMLIHKAIPNLSYQLFAQYFKTGNRISYENIYFLRREYLVTFAMMSLIEDDEKYLTKLEEVIWSICDEYTWALPAHIGEHEWNEEARYALDLYACETAASLAEIITLLNEKLSKTVINRAKQEILNRVINQFIGRNEPYTWETEQNNWCAVCGGSIGIAVLYLLDDESIVTQIANQLCLIMKNYLDSFEEDGVCLEGLSYWTYGMSYYVAFADLLKVKTDGKINLFKQEKLKKIAQFQDKCYFKNGRTISFSDGNSQDLFRIGLSHYLTHEFSDVFIPDSQSAMGYHSDHCYRFIPILRDFTWTLDYPTTLHLKEEVGSYSFEQAQWLICNSKNGTGLAMKGGSNNEPHNHNDVGSFIYNHKGIALIADLGAGEYTRDYFNQNRYTIFCNQSFSHSVPIINGKGQKNGEVYKSSECVFKQEFEMSLEFSKAYSLEELKKLNREIRFDKKTGKISLEDRFEFSRPGNLITERFISQIAPVIENDQVIFKQDGVVGKIIFENKTIKPTITIYDHLNHRGEQEQVYAVDYCIKCTDISMVCNFIIEVEEKGGGYESI